MQLRANSVSYFPLPSVSRYNPQFSKFAKMTKRQKGIYLKPAIHLSLSDILAFPWRVQL